MLNFMGYRDILFDISNSFVILFYVILLVKILTFIAFLYY
jgi:hypothetical protein